jgi:hypothetical protein
MNFNHVLIFFLTIIFWELSKALYIFIKEEIKEKNEEKEKTAAKRMEKVFGQALKEHLEELSKEQEQRWLKHQASSQQSTSSIS